MVQRKGNCKKKCLLKTIGTSVVLLRKKRFYSLIIALYNKNLLEKLYMLQHKPEGNFHHGARHVYFTSHPKDHEKFFDTIYKKIRSIIDCVIWYNTEDTDKKKSLILDMDLLIVPITTNLLQNPSCRTLKYDVPYAIKNKKLILPLMLENGLDELYYQYFKELQYLDLNSQDSTAISYDEKLIKYINTNLINDDLVKKIRSAFDAYIFLSYRKKDREYANKLMRFIHQNDFCRDIAIWYDEYLDPGENFNNAILKAIEKSELFTMVVTPNLVNEENYVKNDEYPAALHKKNILPVEMVPTDSSELIKQYPEIPNCIDGYNSIELSNALQTSLLEIACRENGNDPQHNFFIGLAYLYGIDVEKNHERALQLITSAAETNKVPESIEKLVEMYQFGNGVDQDYNVAVEWQKELVNYWEIQSQKSNTERDNKFLFDALLTLGDLLKQKGEIQTAKNSYNKMLNLYNNRLKIYTKNIDDYQNLAVIYERLSDVYKDDWNVIEASKYLRKSISLREHLFKIYETNNVGRDLLYLYIKLGKICQNGGDQNQAEILFFKALDFGEYLVKKEDTLVSCRDLADCYKALGCFYEEKGYKEDYIRAVKYYKQMFNLYERLKNEEGTVYDWKNLMYSLEILGTLHEKDGDLENAEMFYKQAITLYKEFLLNYDESIENKFFLLSIYERLGDLYIKKENDNEAEKYYRKKIALDNALVKKINTNEAIFSLLASYERFINLNNKKGNYDETEKYCRKMFDLIRQIRNTSIKAKQVYLGYYMLLGDFFKERGNFEIAEKFFREGIAISKLILEKKDFLYENVILVFSYQKIINLCKEMGNIQDADKYYHELLELENKIVIKTENVSFFRGFIYSYMDYLRNLEKLSNAEEIELNIINFIEQVAEKTSNIELIPDLIRFFNIFGNYFLQQKNLTKAKYYFEESLDLCWKLLDTEFTEETRYTLAIIYWNLGQVLEQEGPNSKDEAQECYRKQSDICEGLIEENESEKILRLLSFGYERQGNIYYMDGNLNKALDVYEKAFFLSDKLLKENNNYVYRSDLAIGYHQLGLVYLKLEKLDDAEKFFQNSYILLKQNLNETHSIEDYRSFAICYQDFGELNSKKGDLEKAESFYREYLNRRKKIFEKTNDLQDYQDLGTAYILLACYRKPYDQNLLKEALKIYNYLTKNYPLVEKYIYYLSIIQECMN